MVTFSFSVTVSGWWSYHLLLLLLSLLLLLLLLLLNLRTAREFEQSRMIIVFVYLSRYEAENCE